MLALLLAAALAGPAPAGAAALHPALAAGAPGLPLQVAGRLAEFLVQPPELGLAQLRLQALGEGPLGPERAGSARLLLSLLALDEAELAPDRRRLAERLGEPTLAAIEDASRQLRELRLPGLEPEAFRLPGEDAPTARRAAELAERLAAGPAEPGALLEARFDGGEPSPGPAPAEEAAPLARPGRARLRELGIVVGRGKPGRWNAITDVPGVRVGHVTLDFDPPASSGLGPARTGVTAVLPHGGDLWREKVPAAVHVINGAGELTGRSWIEAQGALEVPILLTNTMSVGRVADGVVSRMLRRYPAIGDTDDVVIPCVGECDDSSLNDQRARHVRAEHAEQAIEAAAEGPVAEGAVGAGTGMIAFEFKAGIGTASRVLEAKDGGWTVGVLVNANHDRRPNLTVAGVPVGRELTELMPGKPPSDGSIIIVVATDAPLDPLRLSRLAARTAFGLARTGAVSRHGSGDIALAFSTGNRVPHDPEAPLLELRVVPDNKLTPLFEAVEEAVEEAVLNALTAAVTVVGRGGFTAHALPLDRLVEAVLRRRP